MKFYIAARFNLKNEVNRLTKEIKKYGHKVIGTWVKQKNIKPYEKHAEISKINSIKSVNQIKNCDVFVLLTDEEGTGMYIELGVAIFSNTLKNKPKIYIIGKHLTRSMFYFHPAVNRRKTIKEVLKELNDN
jgi:hypothetical protein